MKQELAARDRSEKVHHHLLLTFVSLLMKGKSSLNHFLK